MLTDIHVSSAKAKGKPYKLSDGGGLYLHVTANGTRTWRYDYRLEGKRYTVVLGIYPGTSLKVARTRHLAAHTAVSEGQHPLRPKQKDKSRCCGSNKGGTACRTEQLSSRCLEVVQRQSASSIGFLARPEQALP